MPHTRPVIREPYYDCPVWIESEVSRNEVTYLSSESSTHDVELFLLHLFGYNNIDVSGSIKSSFDELFELDEVAIVCSDDPQTENKDLYNIRYTYREITESLEKTMEDLRGFIEKPLFQWLETRDKEIACNMKTKMYKWFLKD